MAVLAAAPLVVLGLLLGGNDVTVSPTTGTVTFTGNVPSVQYGSGEQFPGPLPWLGLNLQSQQQSILPVTGAVAFTGNVPTVQSGVGTLNPAPFPWLGLVLESGTDFKIPQTGLVTFTGNVPGVSAGATLTGVTGELTFVGNVPTITNLNPPYTPTTGVVTFTGNQSVVSYQSLDRAVWHELPVGWYADVGYVSRFIHFNIGLPTQSRDSIATFTFQPSTGDVTFTGNVAAVGLNVDRSPTTGEVEFTGGIPVISQPQIVLSVSTGQLLFVGNQPGVDTQSLVQPSTGVVGFVGNIPYVDAAPSIEPGSTGNIGFAGNIPLVDTQEQIVSPNSGTLLFYGNVAFYTGAIRTEDLGRPTGGWKRKTKKAWYETLPTTEEVEEERIRLGILPKKAQKIVKDTVDKATDNVSKEQAALLTAAYLEENKQRALVEKLREKAAKSKTKWSDEMFTVTRALILDELRKKADRDELERILREQEHEEVEANEILEIWMDL